MKQKSLNQQNLTRRLRRLLVLFAVLLLPLGARAYTYDEFNKDDQSFTTKPIDNGFTVVSSPESGVSRYSMGTSQQTTWYILNADVTINVPIEVFGNVKLLLCDGCTLTASQGIVVPAGSSLTIYGQTNGTGTLIASARDDWDDQNHSSAYFSAAIGGSYYVENYGQARDYIRCGSIYIHGGQITADASNQIHVGDAEQVFGGLTISTGIAAGIGGCGIGTGSGSDGGIVEIYGGTVTAIGSSTGAGIGGGYGGNGGTVKIYGGTVTATGGSDGSTSAQGIGAGNSGSDNGTLTLYEDVACYGDDNTNPPTTPLVTGSSSGSTVNDRYRYMKTIESLGLSVGGVTVTKGNASDILGDGTVSYDVSTNTLTLNNLTATYSGNYIESSLATLNIDLLGENKIDCTDAAIYNTYNNASLYFKSTDTYYGSLSINSIGVSGATLYSGFNNTNVAFETGLDYNPTSQSIHIQTTSYSLWVGHEDLYVTFKNKDNITYDNFISLGANGKVSYDPDNHTLTLNNATINGCGIIWREDENLTIKLIGTSSINPTNYGFNNCIIADGQTAAPTITFEKDGSSSSDCTLTMTCSSEGYNVIDGFSNSTSPDVVNTGGLWWIPTTDNLGATSSAIVCINYGLTVAGILVTNVNASNVLNDGKVSYNNTTKTLTLDGADITGSVDYDGNEDFTIALNGTNSITYTGGTYVISGYGNLLFAKATGATNANLEITGNSFYYSILNFTNCSSPNTEDGLYWIPSSQSSAIVTTSPNYVLVDGYAIASGQTINGTSGTISYTESGSEKILTLTNYVGSSAIETGIEGLTVKLSGTNTITLPSSISYAFVGLQANASIGFVREDNGNLTINSAISPCNGFSNGNITYDGLICYEPDDQVWSIKRPSKPQLQNAVNGTDFYTYATIDYANADKSSTTNTVLYSGLNPQLKYSFDYSDASLTDITNADYPSGGIKMTNPGVLTAWVEVGTVKSEEVTGVRFGSTENPVKMISSGYSSTSTKTLDIQPSNYLTGVGITLQAKTGYSFDNTNNELSVPGFGKDDIYLTFNTKSASGVFVTLGDTVKIAIEATPSAPTISFDANKTYLDTDEIKITNIDYTTIFYTWGNPSIGTEYTHSADNPVLTELTGTGVTAQTGTLKAWAGYSLGGNSYLLSPVASQAFTTKMDIASCPVTLPVSATYTGTPYVPIVKASSTSETELTSGTDYTVSYKKVVGADETNVQSMVDAGTYKITFTGIGNYGGTKEVTSFQIAQATPTITKTPTAKTLTYTSVAQALVEAGTVSAGTLVYSKSLTGTFTESIPEETNADTYIVYYKVNGNANYKGIDASESNKVSVTISPATITDVTLAQTSLPYSGAIQTATISSVKAGDLTLGTNDYNITNEGGKDVGTYYVTVTGKGNFTGEVTKSFEIVNRTLNIGQNGDVQFADGQTWASFYSSAESLELPAGIMAYIVTAVNSTSATVKAINYVPKNVPVFLEKSSTVTTTNSSAEGNLLKGTTASTPVSGISGTVYALHNNLLMQVTTGSISTGRCYLEVNNASGARKLSIIYDEGGSTSIQSLEADEENDADEWYMIDGRKLQKKPTKEGLYIKNGKKVVIK